MATAAWVSVSTAMNLKRAARALAHAKRAIVVAERTGAGFDEMAQRRWALMQAQLRYNQNVSRAQAEWRGSTRREPDRPFVSDVSELPLFRAQQQRAC